MCASRVESRVEPIAVVGLGCRFPGAENPEAFWKLLRDGRSAIAPIPADRWNVEAFYEDQLGAQGKMNTRRGGFLERVDGFDAPFFGVSRREAIHLDPQQRLLLEVSWEALEYGGLAPERLAGARAGVFVGIGGSDYGVGCLEDVRRISAYSLTGNLGSLAANRLSHCFDFKGPSMSLDTACSSSLLAVHLACQSLRLGECELALAGGVNLILRPHVMVAMSQSWILAADGQCKAFSAAGDGYGRGEGCGMVVLKRLAEALRDRDCIFMVIRGTAVDQDGRGQGLTAPNPQAQQAVIAAALEQAGVRPEQLDYVEAHGIGSQLADGAELEALNATLGRRSANAPRCWLGSVKSNIGHLETASGVAALIKVALCLQQRAIVPHRQIGEPHPALVDPDSPLALASRLEPWVARQPSRFAGINSFGIGGTNVHVVVQEAPPAALPIRDNGPWLFLLSASNQAALQELAGRLVAFIEAHADSAPGDVCGTLACGRSHFESRLAIVAASLPQLKERLRRVAAGSSVPPGQPADNPAGDASATDRTAEGISQAGDAQDCGRADSPSGFQLGSEESSAPDADDGERMRELGAGGDPAEAAGRMLRCPPVGLAREQLLQALGVFYEQGVAMDWSALYPPDRYRRVSLPTYPFQRRRYWLATDGKAVETEVLPRSEALRKLEALPVERRWEALLAYLRGVVAELLGQELPEEDSVGFFALGMTSLMAIELHHRLQRDLGLARPLPATAVFDFPNIEALAAYLGQEILPFEAPALVSAAEKSPLSGVEAMLQRLEAMSEDQASRLLEERLARLEYGNNPKGIR